MTSHSQYVFDVFETVTAVISALVTAVKTVNLRKNKKYIRENKELFRNKEKELCIFLQKK